MIKANKTLDINGTSLQGYITTSYTTLVKMFGRHIKADYKTDAEWYLETPFGVGMIYNYKDGKNYLGRKDGLAIKDITDWHIGGHNKETAIIIQTAIQSFEAGYNLK